MNRAQRKKQRCKLRLALEFRNMFSCYHGYDYERDDMWMKMYKLYYNKAITKAEAKQFALSHSFSRTFGDPNA